VIYVELWFVDISVALITSELLYAHLSLLLLQDFETVFQATFSLPHLITTESFRNIDLQVLFVVLCSCKKPQMKCRSVSQSAFWWI